MIRILQQSWKQLTDWRALLPLFFVDLLFLAALGIAGMLALGPLLEHLVALNSIASLMAQRVDQAESLGELFALQEQFTTHYHALLYYTVILLIVAALLWTAFQCYTWRKTHSLLGKKTRPSPYYKNFAIITFVFLFAKLLVTFLYLFSFSKIPGIGLLLGTFLNLLYFALLLALLYFLLISYALVPRYGAKELLRQTFRIGFRRFVSLFFLVAVLEAIFFAVLWIIQSITAVHVFLGIAGILFLFVPLLSWTRIVMILAVERKG